MPTSLTSCPDRVDLRNVNTVWDGTLSIAECWDRIQNYIGKVRQSLHIFGEVGELIYLFKILKAKVSSLKTNNPIIV